MSLSSLTFSASKMKILKFLLTGALLLFGYALYKHGGTIHGPFVFMDELEYFSYARDIFNGNDLSNHITYGVLYPALASLFFYLGDVEHVYHGLRIFNIVILISSAIPAYLLVRAWLLHPIMLFLFPLFTVAASFSGFTYILWADPLYYVLFLWTALKLFSFYRNHRISNGIVVGILLSLLFHAKPGAGLVVQIAVFFSLMIYVGITVPEKRRKLTFSILTLIICTVALTLPWIMRNLYLDAGLIGYPSFALHHATLIAEHGLLHLIKEAFLSFFYQLSYVFIGTWGLIGVVVFFLLKCRYLLRQEEFIFCVFVVINIFGLMLLSAIGMSTYSVLEYWMPNGRYLSITFPIIFLLSIGLIARIPSNYEKSWISLIMIIFGIVVFFASPLKMLSPASFINNTELALPIWIIDKGAIIWRNEFFPTDIQRVFVALGYAGIGLILIWTSQWRRVSSSIIFLFLFGSLVVTLKEHQFVGIMGATQSGMNNFVNHIRLAQVKKEKLVLDEDLRQGNIPHMISFWMSNTAFRFSNCDQLDNLLENAMEDKYIISKKKLPLPVVFNSNEWCVYKAISDK